MKPCSAQGWWLLLIRVLLPLVAVWVFTAEASWVGIPSRGENPLHWVVLIGSLSGFALAPWFPLPAALIWLTAAGAGLAYGDASFMVLTLMPVLAALVVSQRWWINVAFVLITAGMTTIGYWWGPRYTVTESLLSGLLTFGVLSALVGLAIRHFAEVHARSRRELAEAEARLAQVRQDERLALSRELHDFLGHNLASISLQVEAFSGESENSMREAMGRIQRLAHESTDQLRTLVGILRTNLEPAAAAASMAAPSQVAAQLAQELNGAGFMVSVSVPEIVDTLPKVVKAFVSRFWLEATTNIVKHAAAGASCLLMAQVGADGVHLLVANDVVDDHPMGTDLAWGLVGLRERAELLGGSLSTGAEARRWIVRAQLPS